ncbi:aldo/keto reductase [Coleofasciculus sp. FACHB-1120]|uniref:aldo/keto reductase n=1 Tax=Coleofasciculus sp. FACHB-1120 TaxID=2692783 RepID=UPI001682DF79|nr:aldo/keto reductase [Coleofasciculus sp. FACHB-1120]MBD2741187.1 aldo/keto reductase [Coleofasciculus sp. FACHB-1120]
MNSQEKSSFIVGCWQLDDRSWKRISEADIARALDIYLALGITHFDTADIYGRSESVLGRLLKGSDCTILTKAVFFGNIPNPTQIRSKIENSLRNLQRDTLDCVQIHWHNPGLDFASTFSVFAELLEQGKICKLGVTNFNTPMLEKALQYATISTHQVQYSLIDRRVENSMQSLCLQHNIALLPYGPLAGGFLSDKFRGVASAPSEGSHARGFYYNSMIRAHGGWQLVLEMLDTLAQVAKKYEKTISQVALNWVKQQPGVAAVISGFTLDRQQIQKNVEALSFQLDKDDLQLLSDRSSTLFKQPGDIYSYER